MTDDDILSSSYNLFISLGYEVTDISFVGKGEGSKVYKVNTLQGIFCLKLAQYPGRKEKILNEASIRSMFLGYGLGFVPAPIHTDEIYLPYGGVIYEFVEGTSPDLTKQTILKQVAEKLSQIHRLNYEVISDGFSLLEEQRTFLQKTKERLSDNYPDLFNDSILGAFDKVFVEVDHYFSIEKSLDWVGLRGLLHDDVSDNFIEDTKGLIWFIDWENAQMGDIVEEVVTWVGPRLSPMRKKLFYDYYRGSFPEAKRILFERIEPLYLKLVPAFDICWGIDFLATNIEHNLEPDRKLRDLLSTAHWLREFYSAETAEQMIKGVEELRRNLLG